MSDWKIRLVASNSIVLFAVTYRFLSVEWATVVTDKVSIPAAVAEIVALVGQPYFDKITSDQSGTTWFPLTLPSLSFPPSFLAIHGIR